MSDAVCAFAPRDVSARNVARMTADGNLTSLLTCIFRLNLGVRIELEDCDLECNILDKSSMIYCNDKMKISVIVSFATCQTVFETLAGFYRVPAVGLSGKCN